MCDVDNLHKNMVFAVAMARFFSNIDAPKYLRSGLLYERKPVTEIWNRLTAVSKQQWKWKNVADKEDIAFLRSKQRILQIYGPPGAGKSIATFFWVRSVCHKNSVKALWISCAAEAEHCWSIERVEGEGRVLVQEHQSPLTADDAGNAMIVVFDGVRQATLEKWRGLMNDLARLGVAVIVVSSEGVFLHEGDSQDILKLEHFVPSWTLTECLAACSDVGFWHAHHDMFPGASPNDNAMRRKKLLEEKFRIAGNSARFLFEEGEFSVRLKIRGKAQSLPGIESLEQAARNPRSSGAVNSLIARLQEEKNGLTPQQTAHLPNDGDLVATAASIADLSLLTEEMDSENSVPRLVSDFASEEVTKHIQSNVARLRAIARMLSNRAIEGYAFEEQLKKSLNKAALSPQHHLIVRRSNNRDTFSYTVENFVQCKASELEQALRTHRLPNTWIFVLGNQGAFDAIHVRSTTHLRFVQCTVGTRHSYFLDIIDTLLQQLAFQKIRWTHIDFLLLRPESERNTNFSLDTARGGFRDNYLRFDGQEWDRRDYRNNVSFAFLEWTE